MEIPDDPPRLRSRTPCSLLLTGLGAAPAPASATWSIVAVNTRTGQVAISSATCVPQSRFVPPVRQGLMDIQAIVVPGVGVAAAQAGVDNSRENQRLIFDELKKGTPPEQIIRMLHADTLIERRQFGIVDMQGRPPASPAGERRRVAPHGRAGARDRHRLLGSGELLASDEVVYQAARAFREGEGDMLDRMMRAMEAADREGGDRRCTCASDPQPAATPPAPSRPPTSPTSSLPTAKTPAAPRTTTAKYAMYIDVTDQNIPPTRTTTP